MKSIYLEEYEKYCVIIKCEYNDNIWNIVATGDSREEALEKALKNTNDLYSVCKVLLEKVGELLSDQADFSLTRICDRSEEFEKIKFKEPVEINNELVCEFENLYFANDEFKPAIF